MPSCKKDTGEFYFIYVIQAINIFLDSKWRSEKPLERFRSVAKAILLANRWKITTMLKQETAPVDVARTE